MKRNRKRSFLISFAVVITTDTKLLLTLWFQKTLFFSLHFVIYLWFFLKTTNHKINCFCFMQKVYATRGNPVRDFQSAIYADIGSQFIHLCKIFSSLGCFWSYHILLQALLPFSCSLGLFLMLSTWGGY